MKKKVSQKKAPKIAPETATKLNVRIDPGVLLRLKGECKRRGLKIQYATEKAILDWLRQRENVLQAKALIGDYIKARRANGEPLAYDEMLLTLGKLMPGHIVSEAATEFYWDEFRLGVPF